MLPPRRHYQNGKRNSVKHFKERTSSVCMSVSTTSSEPTAKPNTDTVPLEYSYRESKERYGAIVVCGLEKKSVYKPCREVEFFYSLISHYLTHF